MKDWKTYAIAALAVWCAVLTFKFQTYEPKPTRLYLPKESAKDKAISEELKQENDMVKNQREEERKKYFEMLKEMKSRQLPAYDRIVKSKAKELDDCEEKYPLVFRKKKNQLKTETPELFADVMKYRESRKSGEKQNATSSSDKMLSIRRPPRPSLQSATGDNEKEKELERMISDGKKKTINQLSDLKKNNPTHYEQRLMMTSLSLDRAEDRAKNYPLNFSGAFDEEQKKIEDRYGREFLEDVLEYRRKKREKQSAK